MMSVGRLMHKYTYLVRSRDPNDNEVPTDMLRYDKAQVVGTERHEGKEHFKVESFSKPTIARWRSFNWMVFNVDYVRCEPSKKEKVEQE